MEFIVAIIVWIILGFACAGVAESKGFNPVGWFFLGVFFGVFALIAVAFIPSKND